MGFCLGIVAEPLVERVDLVANLTNLDDGVIRCGDLVADLHQQIETLRQIGRRHAQARIGHDFQRSGVRLAQHRELHLVVARQRLRTIGAASPERSLRNLGRSFVAQVPHEAVQAGICRKILALRRPRLKKSSLRRRRCPALLSWGTCG